MSTVSTDAPQGARKFASVILRRLATVKNVQVAQAVGCHETTVGRIASGELGIKLADIDKFLGALGLKIVDARRVCVNVDEYEAFQRLARLYLATPKAQQLDWGDEDA